MLKITGAVCEHTRR